MSENVVLSNLYREDRSFPPPPEFTAQANVADEGVYVEAEDDVEGWWAGHAERLRWMRKWDTVLEWTPPHRRERRVDRGV